MSREISNSFDMKKLLFILIAVFASINSFSQDIITLKTGDEIKSKVLEISTDQVKYKKWENIDGPTYTSLKSDVFMIKYQNGTKDVFKIQEPINKVNAPESNEEVKKNEAVKKLENYVNSKISGPIIKVVGFRKTNGVMNNILGQMIYTINCDIDIKFTSDGWKKGNGLEGYWSSFYVYPSEPNLSASGEQFMYGTKLYKQGTFLTLGCVAEMNNTDNGFEVEKLSINTITNRGIGPISNQGDMIVTHSNQGSSYYSKSSHIGHFNNEVEGKEYTTRYLDKKSPSIDKNLFYKFTDIGIFGARFCGLENFKDDKLIVKKGDTLSLELICLKFKKGNLNWDGKKTEYLFSVQIEDNSGQEYFLETFDQDLTIRKCDPSVASLVDYEIVIPILIDPKKMLLLPTDKDLFLSVLVKGKTEKESIWEGFLKFNIE